MLVLPSIVNLICIMLLLVQGSELKHQSNISEIARLEQRLQSCMQQIARRESELSRAQEERKEDQRQIHQLREQVHLL